MSKSFVTINGTVYDKVTGLPVRSAPQEASTTTKNHAHAKDVHARTQRSKTLSRKHVKRQPVIPVPHKINVDSSAPAAPRVNNAPKKTASHTISKYAPRPAPHKSKVISEITPPMSHPLVAKAAAKKPQSQQATSLMPKTTGTSKNPIRHPMRTHKPSDVLKAEAKAKAFAEAPSHNRAPHREKKSSRVKSQRFGRLASLATSGAALVLIAGYFTYVNMPNLSVRVAAVQAGVDAGYPSYRPSGYSLSGPVAYEDGQVKMAFSSNGTNQNFTLSQTKTSWDSSAVVENYVEPKAGSDYLTTTEGGITVYSWRGNAAWVSNGILHTIDGDAPLSPDQIHRMASSL